MDLEILQGLSAGPFRELLFSIKNAHFVNSCSQLIHFKVKIADFLVLVDSYVPFPEGVHSVVLLGFSRGTAKC